MLISTAQPTSGDEMPPPPLPLELSSVKAKIGKEGRSALKRNPSLPIPTRGAGRSFGKVTISWKGSAARHSGPIKPLSTLDSAPGTTAKAAPNKKPMAMLEEARRDVLPELSYRERKQAFLQSMMSELKASWKPDSMAWVNLHVAGYYYTLDGVTHPRQLASCCLRLDSTQECRWSCWACNLNPAEAAAAGFSPSKSIWPSSTAQFYHWWTVHGKDSHWAWIYEAEEFDLTTREVLQYLLAWDAI